MSPLQSAIIDVLDQITDHLEGKYEVAPGVSVGNDVRSIRAAIDRVKRLTNFE